MVSVKKQCILRKGHEMFLKCLKNLHFAFYKNPQNENFVSYEENKVRPYLFR